MEKSIRREAGAGKPQSRVFRTQNEIQAVLFCEFSFFCNYWLFFLPDSSPVGDVEEAKLYQTWFELVLEKNRLARYESELVIL